MWNVKLFFFNFFFLYKNWANLSVKILINFWEKNYNIILYWAKIYEFKLENVQNFRKELKNQIFKLFFIYNLSWNICKRPIFYLTTQHRFFLYLPKPNSRRHRWGWLERSPRLEQMNTLSGTLMISGDDWLVLQ